MLSDLKIAIIVVLAAIAENFLYVAAATDNVTINLTVSCNSNSVCEANLGENRLNCTSDCPICDNSGVCDAEWGETRGNCAADCATCDRNGVCDAVSGETEINCDRDCPAVGCNNNGICEQSRGESRGNCPADCPLPPEPEEETGGYPAQKLKAPEIGAIEVSDINLLSARILWSTDIAAICRVNFGDSTEYENGTIYETDYAKGAHAAALNGLKAQSIYHFMISCANINGVAAQTVDWQFTTMSLPDTFPPANVSDFAAAVQKKSIDLKWSNPGDEDLAGVRILRAEKFFPRDLLTGQIVYDGRQESFTDTNVAAGTTYYYVAFAYDRSGNYSSGAIASAIAGEPGKEVQIPVIKTPVELQNLDLSQFDFVQNGRDIEEKDGKISIDRFKTFTISIPYDNVPEVLKTIMVTLREGGKSFSFLLRVNRDKTAYEAILVPPTAGEYGLDITVLDYKNQALKRISGILKVVKAQISDSKIEVTTKKYTTIRDFPPIVYIILAVWAVLAAISAAKKYREKRIKEAGLTNEEQA
jgi:hypothetical protein